MTSDLTPKILAYKYLPSFDMNEAIDWAVEMLSLNYETPSLLILAGITKPTTFFETEVYLVQSINELNLKLPEYDDALKQYCHFLIRKIASNENVKLNLAKLHELIVEDYDGDIFTFNLLYWAWSDLDYGLEYQHYWEGATLSNIEMITVDFAKKWLIA